jgi:beta-lactamase class A
MKIILSCLLAVCLTTAVHGQKKHKQLQAKLEELVRDFDGDAGIYVRHLGRGEVFSVAADTVFPTASMIKISIAIGLLNQIEQGRLTYHDSLIYRDSLLYKGEDILGSFKDGEKIWLPKVLMLMLATSDNTASLWCQQLAGTGTVINTWLDGQGFKSTRVNSRTPGRENDRTKYGWGQTSPREIAELMVRIHERKVISPAASERLLRMLSNNYWDAEALSCIPPEIKVFSKNGAVDDSRSEVLLVNGPHGPFVFSVITKNQKDQTWTRDNDGWELIRNVTSLLWEYFEPKDNWVAPEGMAKWN